MSSNNQRSKDSGTEKKSAPAGENGGKTAKSGRENDGGSGAGTEHSAAPKKQDHATSHKSDGKKS